MSSPPIPEAVGNRTTRSSLYWSGVFFSWTMYGVILILGSRYLRRFRSDPLWMRVFVGYLLIHNTVESGVALSSIIKIFGLHYGDYAYFLNFHLRLEDITLLYLKLLNAFYCQLFLVLRSFLVSRAISRSGLFDRRNLVFVVMLFFVLASGAFGVTKCVMLNRLPNYNAAISQFANPSAIISFNYTLYTTLWLGAGSIADILITTALSTIFYASYKSNSNSEKSVQSTNTVLRHLVLITIRNGCLVTLFQITGLFLFLFSSSLWHAFICYILPRIYSITVLVYISSPRQLSRDLAERATLPVFKCKGKDVTPWACSCTCAHGKEADEKAAAVRGGGGNRPFARRIQSSQATIRKLGRFAHPTGSPPPLPNPPAVLSFALPKSLSISANSPLFTSLSNRSSSSGSSSSRRSRKRTRSSSFSVKPRVVVLQEGKEEEEEWQEHHKILVEMASSVEVSVEEVQRGRDVTGEEGAEEDWQERRDRLELGNRIAIETRSSSSPSAAYLTRDLTSGRRSSRPSTAPTTTLASPPRTIASLLTSSSSSRPRRPSSSSYNPPTSSQTTTVSSIASTSLNSSSSSSPPPPPPPPSTRFPLPPLHDHRHNPFHTPGGGAGQHDVLVPFVNSFPDSPVVSMSSGVYDPDADMEYELGEVMYETPSDGVEGRGEAGGGGKGES